jgi:AAT family amino acid transporter
VSPFVLVFERMGIAGAGNVMNFVVIAAAASSCNSGVYCVGRMLYSLGSKGHAPMRFAAVDNRQVPVLGITLSASIMLAGVALNYEVPAKAFAWLTSITLVGILWTWVMIMLAHRQYRRAVKRGFVKAVSYRLPGAPVSTWFVLAAIAFTIVTLWFDPETRVALYVAPVWFALLAISYRWRFSVKKAPTRSESHFAYGGRPKGT